MKFLVFLAVAALATPILNPAGWPFDFACGNFDPYGQTVVAPEYSVVPAIHGDYLDATIIIRGDMKLEKMWTTASAVMEPATYTFNAADVDAGKTETGTLVYTYYPATTADTVTFSCTGVDCDGQKFCTVAIHLHIGHLNHFGFAPLAPANPPTDTRWHTKTQLWFNITKTFYMFEGSTVLMTRVETVAFPIELFIDNTFNIATTTPLTVYGTQNLATTLLLFREYPYVEAPKSLDLKFAFSVQYPFEVTSIQMFNPTGTSSAITAPGIIWTKDDGEVQLITEIFTDGTPKYIYQYVTTNVNQHYVNAGSCSSGPVKWNGDYKITVTLACRPATTSWCSLPSTDLWWQNQEFHFTITSNDICPSILTKDPYTGKIAYSLLAGKNALAAGQNPTTFAEEYRYVADSYVHFIFRGTTSGDQTLRIKQAELQSFTLNKGSTSYPLWTLAGGFMSSIGTPVGIFGQNVNVLPAGIGAVDHKFYTQADQLSTTFYFPTLSLGFKLVAGTFGLANLVTPVTISATGTIKFTYDFFNPSSKKALFGEFLLGAATSGSVLPTPSAGPAAAATSNAGVVIGSSVGAVAVVACVVAFFVVRSRKNDAHNKLTETTA
jgi:hypothetical protein